MKKDFFKKINRNQLKLTPGILGLTTLSFLNIAKPVDAVSLTCGAGNDWLATCQTGIYHFSSSVNINVNLGLSPNNQPDFTTTLSGITSILISNPIDAVIDDPLLGNIGSLDGRLDVIKTETFSSILIGSTPFAPLISSIAGDGVPDLTSTPPDPTLPYESLYTAGAIFEQSNNSALANSFFRFFLEIQGVPEGLIRNRDPLTLTAASPLSGFPAGAEQNFVDYVSNENEITPLFTAGIDKIYWTGDEIEVARLVPGESGRAVVLTLTPASVPEPSTVISSVLVGLMMIFGFKRKELANKS
jgi:hypothetical protein